jgi:hypothetical protein
MTSERAERLALLTYPAVLLGSVALILGALGPTQQFALTWVGVPLTPLAAAILQPLVWYRYESELPVLGARRVALLQAACVVVTYLGWALAVALGRALGETAGTLLLWLAGVGAGPASAVAIYAPFARAGRRTTQASSRGG